MNATKQLAISSRRYARQSTRAYAARVTILRLAKTKTAAGGTSNSDVKLFEHVPAFFTRYKGGKETETAFKRVQGRQYYQLEIASEINRQPIIVTADCEILDEDSGKRYGIAAISQGTTPGISMTVSIEN